MSDLLNFNPKEASIDDMLLAVGLSKPGAALGMMAPLYPTAAAGTSTHQRAPSVGPPASPTTQSSPAVGSRPLGHTRAASAVDFTDLDPFRKLTTAPAPLQPGSQSQIPRPERARVDTPPQIMSADGYPVLSIPNSNEWEISFHDIKLLDKIAEGGFGEVYKAIFRGKIVAVKTVKMQVIKKDPKFVKNFTSEIVTWSRLRHPNVVQFMGACTKLPEACIVCEFMPRGTVYDMLHSPAQIGWEMVKRWALDTALAVNYMHLSRPAVIHRDLKSANLLLLDDGTVKLTDFGLSRTVESVAHMSIVGTTAWTAPEVLASQPYGVKADVFSFGIVLWELVTRTVPYAGMDPVQVAIAVVNQQMRPQAPTNCPPAFTQLMQACWHQNPDMRPNFNEIVFQLQQLP